MAKRVTKYHPPKLLLTPKRQSEICQMIRAGNATTIAKASGISHQTYFNWMRRGREALALAEENGECDESEKIYVAFYEAVERAVGESEATLVARLRLAASEDWRAAAHMLDRRFPERWSQRQQLQLTGADDGPIQVEDVTPRKEPTNRERVAAIAAAMLEAGIEILGPQDDDADEPQ